MGLLQKFLNKDTMQYQDHDVVAVVSGKRIDTADVSDEVFAQQMMGQTIAIQPISNKVVSPMNGTLEVLYPTGHAFAIRSNDGHGILVHIGINTVDLNGKGFKTKRKQGEQVKAGDVIVDVDFEAIKKDGYDPVVLMINTEGEDISYDTFTDTTKGTIISR